MVPWRGTEVVDLEENVFVVKIRHTLSPLENENVVIQLRVVLTSSSYKLGSLFEFYMCDHCNNESRKANKRFICHGFIVDLNLKIALPC